MFTETIEKLSAALADRYTIERELGVGGMATVCLAAGPARMDTLQIFHDVADLHA